MKALPKKGMVFKAPVQRRLNKEELPREQSQMLEGQCTGIYLQRAELGAARGLIKV